MSPPKGPTVDEWLDELSQLSQKASDPGMTVMEMSTQSNISSKRITHFLGLANRAGRLKVGWRTITKINGHACQVPVYTVLKGPKSIVKKKKKP